MAAAVQKITLSSSRDIPFNKLVLSQSNVRRVKAGVSIEELAEDTARRTLLQSLSVRPLLDAKGQETGMFEIPAGGRRYRALELLVKQKRLAKTAPVPCVVREGGVAEEDSLAENVQRAPLHPLAQFGAFQALRERGECEDEIAAAFFVAVNVVKRRRRLAAVSEKLLAVYAEDGMSLDQLMAFAVTTDHARQEQVWDAIQRSYSNEPYQIRRMPTERAIRASDKRAQFVGLAAYEAAGGVVMRDLFQQDHGGWLENVGLLDGVVAEKLKAEAATVATEGWKWVEAALDFPYGHAHHLRELEGATADLTAGEQATIDALNAEQAKLEAEYENADESPDAVDERLGEIEAALAEFENGRVSYDPTKIACAGVFVSVNADGNLSVDRGYVRPEDEHTDRTIHFVAGLLLPIWKRLPNERAQVCRLQTDAGERNIGRRVSPAWAAGAVATGAPALTSDQAFAALTDGGAILDLAEGLQLRRVRVMGASRIELSGFTDAMRDRLRAYGLFHEIISWKLRIFVPTDASGVAILAKVLKRYAIERVAAREAA